MKIIPVNQCECDNKICKQGNFVQSILFYSKILILSAFSGTHVREFLLQPYLRSLQVEYKVKNKNINCNMC